MTHIIPPGDNEKGSPKKCREGGWGSSPNTGDACVGGCSDSEEDHDIFMTRDQKDILCELFSQKEWILLWKFNYMSRDSQYFEVHIDKLITKKKANDEIQNMLVVQNMGEFADKFKLVEANKALFEFTCLAEVGDSLICDDSGSKLSVGFYVNVPNKGIHFISAGHGRIEPNMTMKNTEGSMIGTCKVSIYSSSPKALDAVLVKPEVQPTDPNIALNEVNDIDGTPFDLTMPKGHKKYFSGERCCKFDQSFGQVYGHVDSVDFHFNKKQGQQGPIHNCIAVIKEDDEEPGVPFSTHGESGKLVVIPDIQKETGIALGIIFGRVTERYDSYRETHYTLLAPIWRIFPSLNAVPYVHQERERKMELQKPKEAHSLGGYGTEKEMAAMM